MSFQEMFPDAKQSLTDLQKKYKKIKNDLLNKEDIPGINESLDSLLELIEKSHTDAATSWNEIQEKTPVETALKSAAKTFAWLIGAESATSYLPKLRRTISDLQSCFTGLDATADQTKDKIYNISKQYIDQVITPLSKNTEFTKEFDAFSLLSLQSIARDAFSEYMLPILKSSCENARKMMEEYANHKNKEMEDYKKDHADTNFEDSAVYAYWALLKMIFTSSNDQQGGKHYMKDFGGGFLGLLFTHVYNTLRGPD